MPRRNTPGAGARAQRHEVDVLDNLRVEALVRAIHHLQVLALRSDGNHQAPAGRQLLQQFLGDALGCGGGQNPVERTAFGPTQSAVRMAHVDIAQL